jgi:replicative DNA helicase
MPLLFVFTRSTARPLSDRRHSGAIKQDATGRFPHAGAKMEVEDEDAQAKKKDEAMLILAKNRNGPTDEVLLRFIDHAMRFVERAEEAESP